MINSITIQNFRCFEKTNITEFKQVNLFGGKNNAGKTSLLEALYLSNSPQTESIRLVRQLRKEDDNFAKIYPRKAWDNLFYNQNKEERIIISTTNQSSNNSVEIFNDNSKEDFLSTPENDDVSPYLEVSDLLAAQTGVSGYAKTSLYVEWVFATQRILTASLTAQSGGVLYKDIKRPDNTQHIMMIPSSQPGPSNPELAGEYDKADLAGYAERILQGVKIIDNSIVQMKTLTIGTPTLYLKRENQELMPISLFGEALKKMVTLILRLVNNHGSVLLIDEIENGIHYTNQRELWRMIFRLADEFQIQIFATTHSLEMLKAFQDIRNEEQNQNLGTYIELTRNIRTQQITGIQHDLDTLAYQLERSIGVRGE